MKFTLNFYPFKKWLKDKIGKKKKKRQNLMIVIEILGVKSGVFI